MNDLDYAVALGGLRDAARTHNHRVRQLEWRRHQMVSGDGTVVCTLSLRHGVPVILHGQYRVSLHSRADALSVATRLALIDR